MHDYTGVKRLILAEIHLHGSIFLLYCTSQMNTNKTLELSQNELHAAQFISPLIQCTASTDEAAA